MSATRKTREEWSAGGVVLRWSDGQVHALLIRDPYQNWGLPKGHVEPDEDVAATALREVREETGLRDLLLGPDLGTIDWRFRLRGRTVHKHCRFFLMVSAEGEPVPEAAEGITECVWVPLADAVERITYDNARAVLREAMRRVREPGGSPSFGPGSAAR